MAQPWTTSIGCELELDVLAPAQLALSVAARGASCAELRELMVIESNGHQVDSSVVTDPQGSRFHVVQVPLGALRVRYEATLRSSLQPQLLSDLDALEFCRPSRYCPSDQLAGFARDQFGETADPVAISAWVQDRLDYVPGTSDAQDSAIDTLLAGSGVCRDYAHLVVALCRSLMIPARLVSGYAPGLAPMDFHAVAEVAIDGQWWLLDATQLAPRQSFVRIATGRDAADTAFCTTLLGSVALTYSEVLASTDADLPLDRHTGLLAVA